MGNKTIEQLLVVLFFFTLVPALFLPDHIFSDDHQPKTIPQLPLAGVLAPPLRHDPRYRPARVPPPEGVELGIQTVTINVVYNPGTCSGSTSPWLAPAQTAFAHAVNIWASLLNSSQPIVVHACWRSDLGPGILGSAGPNSFRVSGIHFSGGIPNRAYPVALANSIANADLNGGAHEVNVNLSSTFNWYFGTDSNTPANQVDFVTVVLHELGHGFGFTGSMDVSGGQGSWGINPGIPAIYDHFSEDGSSGTSLINTSAYPNPSALLANALTGGVAGVYFDGVGANLANGNARVPLYAPATWNDGSSFSHLDTGTYSGGPNALMVHILGNGAAIHHPGAITLGMFEDMGWSVNQETDLNITKAAPTSVTVGQNITFTLEVRNTGIATVTDIVITDNVPNNTVLDVSSLSGDGSATGTGPGSQITWTTGQSLTTNEALTRTFVVAVDLGLANGSAITNSGTVSAANLSAVETSNTVATTVAAPLLSASISSDPFPILATTTMITYALNIQNSGDAAATAVVITTSIPASTTYVSGSASDGGSESAPGVIVWPPTTINANTWLSRSFRVSVTSAITNGDQLVNTVSVTSFEGAQIQNQALAQTVGLQPTYLPLLRKNN